LPGAQDKCQAGAANKHQREDKLAFPEPRYVKTNGLNMAVYEQGPASGLPIVMSHGFPELAFSWRHQLPALAEAGFRAIAPDQRGYGNTGGPKGKDAVPLYDMAHLTDDLAGMRAVFGEDMYIVYFQQYGVAEAMFGKDVARSMRFWYRKSGMKLADYDKLPQEARNLSFLKGFEADEKTWGGEMLLTKDELDYYTRAFEKAGYEGGINWYRNFTRNWKLSKGQVEKVNVPSLMISAADDIVLRPSMADGMEQYVPDLEKHIIEDCGHWTQSEKPDELNRLMVDWLKRRFG
jgi:pimeloyl-ACP methyl ester carboxylesterase